MNPSNSRSRAASFAWIFAAYAAGAAAAYATCAYWAPSKPLWLAVLAADVAATCAVFVFSVLLNNSSVYDPYWSVAPMVIAPALAWLGDPPSAGGAPSRRFLVTGLVLAWGARLTWNWARGWSGLAHEDWRYVDLRGKTGRAYWAVSLVGLHMVPTLCVYLGCLSLLPALSTGSAPLGALDMLGAAVTAGAIALEAKADQELRRFRLTNRAPGAILASGLWARSRHPNYLGEILFWWGLFAFSLAADRASWPCVVGPTVITLLFVFVSVPLLDKRSVARRPEYAEHMRRVPGLVPRPWR